MRPNQRFAPGTLSPGPLTAVLALLVLLLTSCRADLAVDVDVEPDGSGTVLAAMLIDAEAADRLLDLDRESGGGIPTRDLVEAGWEVEPPVRNEDGSVAVRAQKRFGTPSQFAEIMDELSGDAGVFDDFTLTRSQSFGRLDYAVTGVIDPSNGFTAFTDPELESALSRSVQSIAERYGASEQNVGIELTVTLPGELQEDQANGQVVQTETDVSSTWEVNLGSGTRRDVVLTTTRRAIAAQVLRGVAFLTAVLAAILTFALILRLIGSLRRPARKTRSPHAADAMGRRPADRQANNRPGSNPGRGPNGGLVPGPDGVDPSTGGAEDRGAYRVVALDGMGVLYREGNDIAELLVPFARQRGSEVPAEDIAAKARLMSLGRLTPAEFWPAIGVPGDPNELDAAYLSLHQLSSGVVKYLRKLRSDGIRAACVTNDAAEWATKLRASHSLDGLLDPWVVSGSVGVRKPDAPVFEVLRRVTGEPPSLILIVDDDLDTLDAARSLGFGTVWFAPDGDRADARGHDLWRGFGVDDEDYVIETVAAVTGEVQSQPDGPTA